MMQRRFSFSASAGDAPPGPSIGTVPCHFRLLVHEATQVPPGCRTLAVSLKKGVKISSTGASAVSDDGCVEWSRPILIHCLLFRCAARDGNVLFDTKICWLEVTRDGGSVLGHARLDLADFCHGYAQEAVFKEVAVLKDQKVLLWLRVSVEAQGVGGALESRPSTGLEDETITSGFVAQPQSGSQSAEIEHCSCGSTFMPDAVFCRKCGVKRPHGVDKDQSRQSLPNASGSGLVCPTGLANSGLSASSRPSVSYRGSAMASAGHTSPSGPSQHAQHAQQVPQGLTQTLSQTLSQRHSPQMPQARPRSNSHSDGTFSDVERSATGGSWEPPGIRRGSAEGQQLDGQRSPMSPLSQALHCFMPMASLYGCHSLLGSSNKGGGSVCGRPQAAWSAASSLATPLTAELPARLMALCHRQCLASGLSSLQLEDALRLFSTALQRARDPLAPCGVLFSTAPAQHLCGFGRSGAPPRPLNLRNSLRQARPCAGDDIGLLVDTSLAGATAAGAVVPRQMWRKRLTHSASSPITSPALETATVGAAFGRPTASPPSSPFLSFTVPSVFSGIAHADPVGGSSMVGGATLAVPSLEIQPSQSSQAESVPSGMLTVVEGSRLSVGSETDTGIFPQACTRQIYELLCHLSDIRSLVLVLGSMVLDQLAVTNDIVEPRGFDHSSAAAASNGLSSLPEKHKAGGGPGKGHTRSMRTPTLHELGPEPCINPGRSAELPASMPPQEGETVLAGSGAVPADVVVSQIVHGIDHAASLGEHVLHDLDTQVESLVMRLDDQSRERRLWQHCFHASRELRRSGAICAHAARLDLDQGEGGRSAQASAWTH